MRRADQRVPGCIDLPRALIKWKCGLVTGLICFWASFRSSSLEERGCALFSLALRGALGAGWLAGWLVEQSWPRCVRPLKLQQTQFHFTSNGRGRGGEWEWQRERRFNSFPAVLRYEILINRSRFMPVILQPGVCGEFRARGAVWSAPLYCGAEERRASNAIWSVKIAVIAGPSVETYLPTRLHRFSTNTVLRYSLHL